MRNNWTLSILENVILIIIVNKQSSFNHRIDPYLTKINYEFVLSSKFSFEVYRIS